jgi:hypothetical protein
MTEKEIKTKYFFSKADMGNQFSEQGRKKIAYEKYKL